MGNITNCCNPSKNQKLTVIGSEIQVPESKPIQIDEKENTIDNKAIYETIAPVKTRQQ
jgi:hypothetical protein